MADLKGLAFEKLNNRNWSTWKFRIEMLLTREEVWHTIAEPKPEPASDQWKKADQKARATIGLCIEESQYSLVKGADSAKGYWDKLCAYHEKSTITTQVALLNKLWAMNVSESGDVECHIRELEEVYDRLAAAGHDLTDSFKIVLLFRSLPESYQGLATVLQSQLDANTTLESVKVKVIEEYERRNERSGRASGSTSSGATAMKSATKKSRAKSSAGKTCYHCGMPGHFRRDCEAWKSAMQGDAEKKNPNVKPSAKKADDDSDVCFMAAQGKRNSWYFDTGASCHMTNDEKFFTEIIKKKGPSVVLADGKVVETAGCGYGTLRGVNGSGDIVNIKLSDVLLVPSLTSGLISVDKLTSKGFKAVFATSGCEIRDKSGKVVVFGERSGSLYQLQLGEVCRKVEEKVHNPLCQHQWHRRFGHRHPGVINRISNEKLGGGMKVVDCGIRLTCEPCIEGKLARNSIPKVAEQKSTQVLDLVHTELCGPMKTITPGGKRFIMTMTDDFSGYTVVYLLAKKTEAPGKIKEYVRFVQNVFGRKPKIIRSDDGVAESKNRSLQEMARTMLLDAGLPKRYWGEAVVAAAFLKNRLPSRSVDATPFQKWHGRKPELGFLRVYGCYAYVHVSDVERGKFDATARKLRFIGYSEQHQGYRFVDPSTDKIIVSRDARFLESGDGSSQNSLHQGSSQEFPSSVVFWPIEDNTEQPADEEDVPEEQDEDQEEKDAPGEQDEDQDEEADEDGEREDFFDIEDQNSGPDSLAVKQEVQEEEADKVAPSNQEDLDQPSARQTREQEPVTFEGIRTGSVLFYPGGATSCASHWQDRVMLSTREAKNVVLTLGLVEGKPRVNH